MSELTNEMVGRRYEIVASGTYTPEIPGLPGLTFVKLGLKERGASSRAYSSKLKELMAAGGYFSEALLCLKGLVVIMALKWLYCGSSATL